VIRQKKLEPFLRPEIARALYQVCPFCPLLASFWSLFLPFFALSCFISLIVFLIFARLLAGA
jgi:hypothetical protein